MSIPHFLAWYRFADMCCAFCGGLIDYAVLWNGFHDICGQETMPIQPSSLWTAGSKTCHSNQSQHLGRVTTLLASDLCVDNVEVARLATLTFASKR